MDSLKKFRTLIEAQDLVRAVYCREEGTATAKALSKIDKELSKAINQFAKDNGIISVTNANLEDS